MSKPVQTYWWYVSLQVTHSAMTLATLFFDDRNRCTEGVTSCTSHFEPANDGIYDPPRPAA